jgi:hypothetical protein
MPLVEQEPLILPEFLSSLYCSFFIVFVDHRLSFFPFLLTIILSVLRFTTSDYPFGIFKLPERQKITVVLIVYCKWTKFHVNKMYICTSIQFQFIYATK